MLVKYIRQITAKCFIVDENKSTFYLLLAIIWSIMPYFRASWAVIQ